MADKRISQLVERTDIANNDVVPIVAFGATTTNKATISSIQEFMQENLDLGVTSVGITLGTTGTDVNVTGSPITTSGNITINIPDASATARGVVSTGSQVFGGVKTFSNGFILPSAGGTNQNSRFVNIGTIHEGSAGSTQIGFNNSNNIYFGKGLSNGGVIQWTNAAVRYYTLPDADGTIALTSDLTGYVTLGTVQTITGQKTFNSTIVGQDATLTSSGSGQTLLVTHSSGSGIALDISKGGNGEGLRVTKTSGSGNAVTITGGALSAVAGQFSGDVQTSTRFAASSGSNGITITPNVGGTQNRIETTGSLPLSLVSAAAITMAAGGTTPQITLATTGAVTLTGALNGTSASFSGAVNDVISVTSTATTTAIKLNNTNANDWGSNIAFQSSSINKGFVGLVGSLVGNTDHSICLFGASGQSVKFFTNANTTPRLTLDSSTGAATFSSSVTAKSLKVENTGTASFLYFNNTSAPASNYIALGSAANEMYFQVNGADRIVIKDNGNLGMGTASPNARLEITSNSPSSAEVQRWSYNVANPDYSLRLRQDVSSGLVKHVFDVINNATTYSNNLVLTNGNVGIGTASPTTYSLAGRHLEVNDAGGGYAFIHSNTTSVKSFFASNEPSGLAALFTFSNHPLTFGTNNTERLRITSGGNVGIGGVTNPSTRLYVAGSGNVVAITSSDNTLSLALGYQGTMHGYLGGFNSRLEAYANNGGYVFLNASSVWVPASDVKRKRNFEEYTLGIDGIMGLKPTLYNMDFQEDGDEKQVGLIAQEVKEFIPHAYEENDEFIGLNYNAIIVTMVKAIQELKTEIDSLKNQIK
jgi:hypothetical protein